MRIKFSFVQGEAQALRQSCDISDGRGDGVKIIIP